MVLNLITDKSSLVSAINNFNKDYHFDFFTTRNAAEEYQTEISQPRTTALTESLGRTLCAWGAGRRKAPKIKTYPEITTALMDTHVIESINFFSNIKIYDLKITDRKIVFANTRLSLEDFKKRLLNVLNLFSKSFFVGNTSITYPMKSLLLLTGFMPAWDSQVRKGLALSGFRGTSAHFLLPDQHDCTASLKISSLPFYLADCYSKNKDIFESAIRESKYPALITEPGRLFDILFFMQASHNKIFLSCNQRFSNWYRLQD